jgi:SAM-dependent methyltransferase
MSADLVEISDVIVAHDARGRRVPVARHDVVERFVAAGNRWAGRIVSALPVDADGSLRADAVDDVLVAAHLELQRLNAEFQQPRRLLRVLRPLLALVDERPRRVVDLGCGVGYSLRWLAAHRALDHTVLTGCDFNAALVATARATAAAEDLDATFLVQDAFTLDEPAHVLTSTGVLHHIGAAALEAFFAAHASAGRCVGFVHFDIEAHWASPLGAALFHFSRMRVPLAQHDGIWSARRAHAAPLLVDAARRALPHFTIGALDRHRGPVPLTRALWPLVGVRSDLADGFRAALGPLAARWQTA